MAGKPTFKGEVEEELIEAACILNNLARDLGEILESLNQNELLDHQNDALRTQGIGFLMDSLEAYNAKDYEGMQKFLHAGMQKLHEQESLDFQDDKPRADVRIKLSELRMKAVCSEERFKRFLQLVNKMKERKDAKDA
jgi:hypothetical protein